MYKMRNPNASFVVVYKKPYEETITVNEFIHFESARWTYDEQKRKGWRTKLFAVCPVTGEKVLMWDSNEEG